MVSDEGAPGTGLERVTQAESLFAETALFQGLEGADVRRIVRACELVAFQPGERLFEQGDQSDTLFIVGQGELEVVARSSMGEKVVLAQLGPGSVVGELSLIEGGPRSATVEVVSPAEIFCLSRKSFEELRRRRDPAAYRIILQLAATVGDRRRETDDRVQEVFSDPAAHIDRFESQLHEMLGRLRKS